jgi:hypothetical protein
MTSQTAARQGRCRGTMVVGCEPWFLSAGAALLSLVLWSTAPADDLHISAAVKLHDGTLVVLHRSQADARDLLIHFHGAVETVRQAHLRTGSTAVLAVVNVPGLSSAYSQPISGDATLFERILRHAWEVSRPEGVPATDPHWRRVTLSSFSAGYGAVREILKTPEHFARVDAVIAADSIYAGLGEGAAQRQVNPVHMQDFLRFARLAGEGRKMFVLSHSSQPTPYASTTETADYLLRELGIERRPDGSLSTDELRQSSRASRGRFVVLGFEGLDAPAHLQHLRRIDLFWKMAEEE